jgi:hypothetical protein
MPMSIIGRGRFRFHFRGWHQLKRPIRVRAAARRAVMPGDEINGRGLDGLAAFTAQAAKQIFECHIALASHQQSHGIATRVSLTLAELAAEFELELSAATVEKEHADGNG